MTSSSANPESFSGIVKSTFAGMSASSVAFWMPRQVEVGSRRHVGGEHVQDVRVHGRVDRRRRRKRHQEVAQPLEHRGAVEGRVVPAVYVVQHVQRRAEHTADAVQTQRPFDIRYLCRSAVAGLNGAIDQAGELSMPSMMG